MNVIDSHQIPIYRGFSHDTLWSFNIAVEHGPFIDDLHIEHCDFPVRNVK